MRSTICGSHQAPTNENKSSREDSDKTRIATFSHDAVNDGRDQTAQKGRQNSQSDVRDLVLDVRVTYALEFEVAVVSDDPTGESEQ